MSADYLKSPDFYFAIGVGGPIIVILFAFFSGFGFHPTSMISIFLMCFNLPASYLLINPLIKNYKKKIWFNYLVKFLHFFSISFISLIAWSHAEELIYTLTNFNPTLTPVSLAFFTLISSVAIWLILVSILTPFLIVLSLVIKTIIRIIKTSLLAIYQLIKITLPPYNMSVLVKIKQVLFSTVDYIFFKHYESAKKRELFATVRLIGNTISLVLIISTCLTLGEYLLKFPEKYPTISDFIIYELDYYQCTPKICGKNDSNKRFAFLNNNSYSLMHSHQHPHFYSFSIIKSKSLIN